MIEIIQQLLFTHNCVIIPGFGALIANYKSAEIHLFENKIIPPYKNIAFNRALISNDGILINAVMHYYSITYKEAEDKVITFSKECQSNLDLNNSIILNDIGKIFYDNDKNIQFQSYNNNNYLLSSYGLIDLGLSPIQRLKDSDTEIKEAYQRILHPELIDSISLHKVRNSKYANLVTVFFAVVLILTTLGINIHNSTNLNTSLSSVFPISNTNLENINQNDVLKPIKKEQIETKIPKKVVVNGEVFPTALDKKQKEAITESTEVVSLKNRHKSKSYIVIGACFDIKMAEKIRASAAEKEYNSIISKEVNRYRITIEVDNDKVKESLLKIQNDFNAHAWVYCIKCNI